MTSLLTDWLRERRQDADDRVLRALDTDEWTYVFDLWRATQLRGRFYPALRRLQRDGWIEGRWDEESTAPRRHRPMFRRTFGDETWQRWEATLPLSRAARKRLKTTSARRS